MSVNKCAFATEKSESRKISKAQSNALDLIKFYRTNGLLIAISHILTAPHHALRSRTCDSKMDIGKIGTFISKCLM